MAGYRTGINPEDIDVLIKKFGDLANKIDGTTNKTKELNESLRGPRTLGGRNVSDIGGGRGSFIGPPAPTAAQIARQIKADSREETRVREQFFRMWDKRASETLKPKTQEEKVRDAIMTSRILPDGTLSPLVGKMAAAGLGSLTNGFSAGAIARSAVSGVSVGTVAKGASSLLGETAGSVAAGETAFLVAAAAAAAIPVIAAAAGGAALMGIAYAGAENAAARIQVGTNAFWQSGGTPSELAQGIALGGENAGSKAEALAGRLRGGSYGAALARSKGIADFGDYATPDKMTNYIKALDLLNNTKDKMQRVRLARDLGLQEDAWTSDLSPSSYKNLKKSRMAYSDEDRQSEAEYRSSKEQLGGTWDRLARSVGPKVMNGINAGIRGDGVGGVAVRFLSGGIGKILDLADTISNIADGFSGNSGNNKQSGQAEGSTNPAMPRYRSIKDGPDWSDSPDKMRNAVPPGIIAQAIDKDFNFGALNLGGFSMSSQ